MVVWDCMAYQKHHSFVWFLIGENYFESLIVGSDDESLLPKEGQTCIRIVLVRADVTDGGNIVDFGLAVRDPQQPEILRLPR